MIRIKIIALISFFAVVLNSTPAFAWHGQKWGAQPHTFSHQFKFATECVSEPQWAGKCVIHFPLKSGSFVFAGNAIFGRSGLERVLLKLEDAKQTPALLETLKAKYGRPFEISEGTMTWHTTTDVVVVIPDDVFENPKNSAAVVYTPRNDSDSSGL